MQYPYTNTKWDQKIKLLFGRVMCDDTNTVESMLEKRSLGDLSTQKEASQPSEKQESSIEMMAPVRKELKIEKIIPSEEADHHCGSEIGKMPSFSDVTLKNIERHLYFNRCKKSLELKRLQIF